MHNATAHPTSLPGIEATSILSDRSSPCHAHDHSGIGRIVAGGHASLDELSHIAELGLFALLRRFSSEVGITPHAYASQFRVRIARRAIDAGSSLADVAVSVGLADQSHMTRVFARQFGMPPGRYRARALQSERNIVQDVKPRPP